MIKIKFNIILIFLFCLGCSNNNEKLSQIIRQNHNMRVLIDTRMDDIGEKYILKLYITNQDSVAYYLSLSDFWVDYESSDLQNWTEPVNTYTLNTIYLIDIHKTIGAMIAINSGVDSNKIPMYLRIHPNATCTLKFKFEKVQKHDHTNKMKWKNEHKQSKASKNQSNNKNNRFDSTITYKIISQSTIINQKQFEQFYNELGFYKNKRKFVILKDSILFDSFNNKRVMKFKGKYSDLELDAKESNWINELHNEKVTLIDTLGKIY